MRMTPRGLFELLDLFGKSQLPLDPSHTKVFGYLNRRERGAGNEIQLTDSLARLIGEQPFHGFRYDGTRYDCGDKSGFLAANIAFGLARPDVGPGLADFIRGLKL